MHWFCPSMGLAGLMSPCTASSTLLIPAGALGSSSCSLKRQKTYLHAVPITVVFGHRVCFTVTILCFPFRNLVTLPLWPELKLLSITVHAFMGWFSMHSHHMHTLILPPSTPEVTAFSVALSAYMESNPEQTCMHHSCSVLKMVLRLLRLWT